MGCFLACFGFTNKRKRPSNKILSSNQRHGRYIALDSDNNISDSKRDITQKTSDYEPIDKPKEATNLKIKKKVRFNLNVKSYEPIQNDENDTYISESDEKTKWELNKEETQRSTTMFHNYPADYRYKNCRDDYDDEDEIVRDDSDEIYDSDINEEEEYETTINKPMQDEELNEIESKHNVRYINSVLNPIENLSHWKAVKARSKLQQENILLVQENGLFLDANKDSYHVLLEKENSVNSSLSNWLISSNKEHYL